MKIVFEARVLDENNWVIDFGALKPIKEYLIRTFDHKLLVAKDDPAREIFYQLDAAGLAAVVAVDAVGCEAFAHMIGRWVVLWLGDLANDRGLRVRSVTVAEHAGNSATCENS